MTRGLIASGAMLAMMLVSACIPGDRSRPYRGDDYGQSSDPYDDRGDDQQRGDRPYIDRPYVDRPNDAAPPPRPPVWEARPVTADAQDVPAGTYIVGQGDTLRGIANRTGAGSEAIARANGLQQPFVIYPGQRLNIPPGRYHLVRSGETGIAIARAYGVDWAQVVAENDLSEPYILRAGQRIVIPNSRPMTNEQRRAALRLDIEDIVTGGEPALAVGARPAPPSRSPTRLLPPDVSVAAPDQLTRAFRWPVNGQVVRRFGRGATGERNDGIKIAVPNGTPVLAVADGVVAYTGDDVAGLGGLVMLKHGDNWTSVYGHNGQILVQRGQSVKRGQTVALSGDTGFADRPELHFELRKGRSPVDPLTQLPKR